MTEATSKTKRSKPSGLAKLGTRLKRRGEVTALDIDKRMLRVVHVTSSRGTAKVSRVELIPVPTEDFDLQNPKIVGEWIGDQLKAIRLTPGTVVMAVRPPRSSASSGSAVGVSLPALGSSAPATLTLSVQGGRCALHHCNARIDIPLPMA